MWQASSSIVHFNVGVLLVGNIQAGFGDSIVVSASISDCKGAHVPGFGDAVQSYFL